MFNGQIQFNRLTPVLRTKGIDLKQVYSITFDSDNLEKDMYKDKDMYYVNSHNHTAMISREYLRQLFEEGNIQIIKKYER